MAEEVVLVLLFISLLHKIVVKLSRIKLHAETMVLFSSLLEV